MVVQQIFLLVTNSELFGLLTPTIRCGVHAADSSLKRLANSETMNVQEVTDFVQNFRKVMKHFQNSAKSTSLLNDTLAVFSMKKVHLMTFCPTRMSYLFDACLKAVKLFITLCDVLTTIGIKKEETDSFLAPKNLFIVHILADLQPVFNKYLIKAGDKDDGIIINTFSLNKGLADHLSQEFDCTKLKSFVEGLSVDDKGNIVC